MGALLSVHARRHTVVPRHYKNGLYLDGSFGRHQHLSIWRQAEDALVSFVLLVVVLVAFLLLFGIPLLLLIWALLAVGRALGAAA